MYPLVISLKCFQRVGMLGSSFLVRSLSFLRCNHVNLNYVTYNLEIFLTAKLRWHGSNPALLQR